MVKKLITLDGLAVFLSELRKEINAGSGKCFDAEELARRIPSWQWKVTLPKSDHQTVTATVGEQTYTNDFYAQQGSEVKFSVKANPGYIAGSLSATSTTIDKDLVVTVTDAEVSEELTAGSISFPPEYFENRNDFEFEVPYGVAVLELKTTEHKRVNRKWTYKDIFTYFRVAPGTKLLFGGDLQQSESERCIRTINCLTLDNPIYVSDKDISLSWSEEINEHATDIDLTEFANKWIMADQYTGKMLVPDKFNVLRVEIGNEVKYVKLGEKRTLSVSFFCADGTVFIMENEQIFYIKGSTQKTCTVSWSDEIDTHTPDIEL